MQRLFFSLAIAALALANSAVQAADPAPSAPDQQMANQIKGSLCSGQLHHYSIDVKVAGGTCWLNGTVQNRQQLDTALNIVADTQGIEKVVNGLKMIDPSSPVVQASAPPQVDGTAQLAIAAVPSDPPAASISGPSMSATAEPRPSNAPRPLAMARAQPLPGGAGFAPGCAPGGMGGMGGNGGPNGGPIPAYAPGVGGGIAPAHFDRANMPCYAWPSYASYPNYAGITYPRQYSPTAWPFIGPFYPYPQVPLGWRKVTLEWHNGWWNLDFKDGDGGCH